MNLAVKSGCQDFLKIKSFYFAHIFSSLCSLGSVSVIYPTGAVCFTLTTLKVFLPCDGAVFSIELRYSFHRLLFVQAYFTYSCDYGHG